MKLIPFKSHIEVSAAQGEDPHGPGAVVAILRVTAKDTIILRQYQILGAPCSHLFGQANPEDQKEITKIVTLMQLVAKQLEISIKIDRNAISALVFFEEDLSKE